MQTNTNEARVRMITTEKKQHDAEPVPCWFLKGLFVGLCTTNSDNISKRVMRNRKEESVNPFMSSAHVYVLLEKIRH